eukprot:1317499-Amorphochlora_amoeboformis.AAC.1
MMLARKPETMFKVQHTTYIYIGNPRRSPHFTPDPCHEAKALMPNTLNPSSILLLQPFLLVDLHLPKLFPSLLDTLSDPDDKV